MNAKKILFFNLVYFLFYILIACLIYLFGNTSRVTIEGIAAIGLFGNLMITVILMSMKERPQKVECVELIEQPEDIFS